MEVFFTRRFEKQYQKLPPGQKRSADAAIRKFLEDPFEPSLRNHQLKGELAGNRSIKAGYDLRIIYADMGGHVLIHFIAIGTHDQVY